MYWCMMILKAGGAVGPGRGTLNFPPTRKLQVDGIADKNAESGKANTRRKRNEFSGTDEKLELLGVYLN